MEKIFRVFKCSETEKVQYAVFQLDKMAYDWWLSTEGLLRGGDDVTPPKSITWNEFKEEFLDKYVPLSVKDRAREELLDLKQGENMSVTEYQNKFEELCRFAPGIVNTEENKALQFVKGLYPDIKEVVKPFQFRTYSAVVEKARVVEHTLGESKIERKRRGFHSSQQFDRSKKQNTQSFVPIENFSYKGNSQYSHKTKPNVQPSVASVVYSTKNSGMKEIQNCPNVQELLLGKIVDGVRELVSNVARKGI